MALQRFKIFGASCYCVWIENIRRIWFALVAIYDTFFWKDSSSVSMVTYCVSALIRDLCHFLHTGCFIPVICTHRSFIIETCSVQHVIGVFTPFTPYAFHILHTFLIVKCIYMVWCIIHFHTSATTSASVILVKHTPGNTNQLHSSFKAECIHSHRYLIPRFSHVLGRICRYCLRTCGCSSKNWNRSCCSSPQVPNLEEHEKNKCISWI